MRQKDIDRTGCFLICITVAYERDWVGRMSKYRMERESQKNIFIEKTSDSMNEKIGNQSMLKQVEVQRLGWGKETANIVIQRDKFDDLYMKLFGEPTETVEIPRIIHRFWAGGAMSATTFENIIQLQIAINQHNTRNPDQFWKQILWTSIVVNEIVLSKGDKSLMGQLDVLRGMGVEIKDSFELIPMVYGDEPTKEIEAPMEGFTKRHELIKKDMGRSNPTYIPLKYYSDTIRLMAVYQYGGVYMDTDIGPGMINLAQTFRHRDAEAEIPLAGAQVHNSQVYTKEQESFSHWDEAGIQYNLTKAPGAAPEGDERVKEELKRGVDERKLNLFLNTWHTFKGEAPVFNFFFASRARNPRFKKAVTNMLLNPEDSGMEQMAGLFAGTKGFMEWVIPWILDLDWATSASDIQEGE